jgi:hypothetical protein
MILDKITGKSDIPKDNIFLRGMKKGNVDWIKAKAKDRGMAYNDFMDALIDELRSLENPKRKGKSK